MNHVSSLPEKGAFEVMAGGLSSNLKLSSDWYFERSLYLGLVENLDLEFPIELMKYRCRSTEIILKALKPLKSEVTQILKKTNKDRIAVVVGTSASGVDSGIAVVDAMLKNKPSPEDYDYSQLEVGGVGEFIAKYLGVTGINYTISTACSSSAKAFASALKILKTGLADYVITGGSEAMGRMTVEGFGSLGLLSQKLCNPFGEGRDGINIGEGAAFFILKGAEFIEPNKMYLLGTGEGNDAYHISSPEPEGRGAIMAIKNALLASDLKPDAINYINLHGTGTPANDQMESFAVNSIFSDKTYCSSTKAYTGHTLGASSAIEAWICLSLIEEYLKNGEILLPQNLFSGEYGRDLRKINLVKNKTSISGTRINILSNSFGFGGSNCALIFGGIRC